MKSLKNFFKKEEKENIICSFIEKVENTDTEYKIDITSMLSIKHVVPMQYETITVGGTTEILHEISKKVDRYLLHIVEEITEFLEEYEKDNIDEIRNETLMELIDVISYITSLLSIFCIDYYGLDDIKNSKLIVKKYIQVNNPKYFKNEQVNFELLNIEKILINKVRRLFPERKWHKDTDRNLSIKELNYLYDACMLHTTEALTLAIRLFMHLSNCNIELFTNMFVSKNNEIYSLKN